MDIEIKNFRSLKDKKIKFSNGVSLLKGKSGAGKTTVFEAIKWCFYGSLKGITPVGGNLKTEVIIKTSKALIKRSNHPENITVNYDDRTYENKEATGIIDNLFGTKNIWLSSSYLSQNDRNLFFKFTNFDKIDLIKEMIFNVNEDEIDNFKEKNIKYIEDISIKINKTEGSIEVTKQILEETKNSSKFTEEEFGKAKKLEKLRNSKEKLLRNYNLFVEDIDTIENNIKINQDIDSNEKILKDTKEKLSVYPFHLTLNIINKWKNYINITEKIKELNYSGEENILTLDELISIKNEICDNNKIIESLGITKDEVNDKLKEFKEKISVINKYNNTKTNIDKYEFLHKNINSLNNFIEDLEKLEPIIIKKLNIIFNSLHIEPRDFDIFLYQEIKTKLMQCSNESLLCPSCDKELVLEKGSLVIKTIIIDEKLKNNINVNLEKIKTYYNNLDESKNKLEKLVESSNLVKEDDNLLKPDGIDNLDYFEKSLNILRNFKENNHDLEDINRLITDNKKKTKLEILEKSKSDNYVEDFDKLEIPEDFDLYFSEYNKLYNNKLNAEKFLRENIKKDTENLEEKITMKNRIEDSLKLIDKSELVLDEYEKINNLEDKVKKYNDELMDLYKKKEKALEIKYKFEEKINENLELFITDLNNSINEILQELFDDISVEISLFKKLKSKEVVKPQVNIIVNINGNKFDNINMLSGGEKDRLSMGFTIALNKFNNSPFLILDECMSSLDSDLREKSLEIIKKYSKDKIVVNICHETIEGYYDEVINF